MLPNCTSSGKEEPIPKTILGDGQEKHWDLDLDRSNRKEHRAAEDVPRSGPTETRDQVAVRGMEFLGSVVKMGEIQLHGKPSKGIAPQPMGTQGDQKEKESLILLQVGTEKKKKKNNLKRIGRREKYIGGWRKRSSRPREKIISCRWKRSVQGKDHQPLDPKNTVGRSSSAVLVREGIQKPTKLGL